MTCVFEQLNSMAKEIRKMWLFHMHPPEPLTGSKRRQRPWSQLDPSLRSTIYQNHAPVLSALGPEGLVRLRWAGQFPLVCRRRLWYYTVFFDSSAEGSLEEWYSSWGIIMVADLLLVSRWWPHLDGDGQIEIIWEYNHQWPALGWRCWCKK